MTLRDFLVSNGYLVNSTGSKARCPFHADRNPSAMVHDNDNTLYCFACHKLYRPSDFLRFGVHLDTVSEVAPALELEEPWGTPLFYC